MLPRRKHEEPIREMDDWLERPADSEPTSGTRRVEVVELGAPVEIADGREERARVRDTDVSEAHDALGRLTDPSARAVFACGTAAYVPLTRDESHTLALAATGARMDIVMALSPMPEAETIQLLARLVLSGVLRIV
jgi:hypothetical protein